MNKQELAKRIIIDNFKQQIIDVGYDKLFSMIECLTVEQRIRYRNFLNQAKKELENEE